MQISCHIWFFFFFFKIEFLTALNYSDIKFELFKKGMRIGSYYSLPGLKKFKILNFPGAI